MSLTSIILLMISSGFAGFCIGYIIGSVSADITNGLHGIENQIRELKTFIKNKKTKP